MKRIVVALLALVATSTMASEPGQPLDCSDWVIVEPGVTCGVLIPADCSNLEVCKKGANLAIDTQGALLTLRVTPTGSCNGGPTLRRSSIVARRGDADRIIAYVDDRCGATVERIGGSDCRGDNFDCASYGYSRIGQALTFDAMSGRLLVTLVGDPGGAWMASFTGFTTTFDVLQTFTPSASALGLRVPYMPEGMPAADQFDTYWGPLTTPIDFAQAQGLACDYPAIAPAVGDYLEVADTLPAPAAGQGYWYLTAATYQGQARVGRKTSGGRLSGREPSAFPGCETLDPPR